MLGIFFTPVMYVALQKLKWMERKKKAKNEVNPASA
jgi:hypothetical protein